MKIDRHISELLYNHDCVIVPSFGGFLGSYQPSQLQPNRHTFYPPSKKIAFNVLLKNNDGLLANHVVQKEKLTYAEALKDIERFRLEVIGLLDSGKRITIENVGTLFYDHQKNLQFEPAKDINYLEDAFGLTAIQSLPVKREEQRKRIERQIREAVSIRSSVKHPQAKTQWGMKTAWKAFNTVALSGALLWFAFNIYLVTPHHQNISSLNPFSYSSSEKVEDPPSTVKPETTKSISTPAQIQKLTDSVDKMLPDKQPPPDNSTTMATPPAHREEAVHAEATVQNEKSFFVIAGVFHEPGNAEKFVNTLKQEGYADAHIIDTEATVKKVCYYGFSTHKEATLGLESIHSAKKEGWILEQ